jgi:hypothetical protein
MLGGGFVALILMWWLPPQPNRLLADWNNALPTAWSSNLRYLVFTEMDEGGSAKAHGWHSVGMQRPTEGVEHR